MISHQESVSMDKVLAFSCIMTFRIKTFVIITSYTVCENWGEMQVIFTTGWGTFAAYNTKLYMHERHMGIIISWEVYCKYHM